MIIEDCVDCWVNQITCKHFSWGCVTVSGGALQTSVEKSLSTEMVGPIKGGWRYPFTIEQGGTMTLMRDLVSEDGRHNYAV